MRMILLVRMVLMMRMIFGEIERVSSEHLPMTIAKNEDECL